MSSLANSLQAMMSMIMFKVTSKNLPERHYVQAEQETAVRLCWQTLAVFYVATCLYFATLKTFMISYTPTCFIGHPYFNSCCINIISIFPMTDEYNLQTYLLHVRLQSWQTIRICWRGTWSSKWIWFLSSAARTNDKSQLLIYVLQSQFDNRYY